MSGRIPWVLMMISMAASVLSGGERPIPVTPNASPEARALLAFFYQISGKAILSGQHNYPNTGDRNTRFAARYIGRTPVIWSSDMGFAEAGDKDAYTARPAIVEEAIRQHRRGALVTLCWHAVPPTADEPVTFQPRPGASPDSLSSVQGRLTDRQFREVLTPGTRLYARWCAQVDTVAFYLKQLQEAHVPVLWRPYHEMNGDWFWWGGRPNEPSTRALYRQLFDRYVHHHGLTNLIWVWSVDRPHRPEMFFSRYYPGDDYLDILSLDVYGNDFNPAYYDTLKALSKGKPLVLGEVGNPPSLEVLQSQPLWAYYVIWAGMVRHTPKKVFHSFVKSPRVLFYEDPAFATLSAPYRSACGLPPLPFDVPLNLAGSWVLREDKSRFDRFGAGRVPWRMEVFQYGDEILIEKRIPMEWEPDRITEERIHADGVARPLSHEIPSRILTARWADTGEGLEIVTQSVWTRGQETQTMTTKEVWSLRKRGKRLVVDQSASMPWGEQKAVLVYERE